MFITDFHIHSHYSIATSKKLIPEHLEYWARIKGINVLGTGDCIHPGWYTELKEKLTPAENGLYCLKEEYRLPESKELHHDMIPDKVYFMLTGEVSNIYKKNERVRKVHNLCVFPNFDAVAAVQEKLDAIGNIKSDGRPILGLDSKVLLEMVLESHELSYLIPAHIWTPWFSVLGSKSGFDRIEECYEDLTQHIYAVETGLSSDPAMNWTCSFLDNFKLVSNSDAHSPEKLGREANLFDCEVGYKPILDSLKGDEGFLGTIEFYPQEGKYHHDGHRKCGIRWDPLETEEHRGICPVCGKKVTKGVLYRVAELADRSDISQKEKEYQFYSITQMQDLLAQIMNQKSTSSKRLMKEYHRLIRSIGSEFDILLFREISEIRDLGGEALAEGIRRLRSGDVFIDEGFDGEFGRISVFEEGEAYDLGGDSLFHEKKKKSTVKKEEKKSVPFNIEEFQRLHRALLENAEDIPLDDRGRKSDKLKFSKEQKVAIEHFRGPAIVIAGPGSGKTRVLTERIQHLIKDLSIEPEKILAVTFSNRATHEIKERITEDYKNKITISTFHSLGLSILKEHFNILGRDKHFKIINDDDKTEILNKLGVESKQIKSVIQEIEQKKEGIEDNTSNNELFLQYEETLLVNNAVDLTDLIYLPVKLFKGYPEVHHAYQNRFEWIMVDEFQDINSRQFEFVRLLCDDTKPNMYVIGDPDQAIYGFRGSDIRFFDVLKGEEDIQVYSLFKSYRCPNPIIKTAGQVLRKDTYLDGQPLEVKINIQETESDRSEADWIAAEIEKSIGGVRTFSIDSGISDGNTKGDSIGFSDFAVLCRSSFMFDPFIEAFQNHGISYQIADNIPFYEKEPYKGVIQILKDSYYSDEKGADADTIALMIHENRLLKDILKFSITDSALSDYEVKKLESFITPFEYDYEGFFRSITLRQGMDDMDVEAEAVSIMTIHAAKGLQFDTVFIPGCEEGIIPFKLFDGDSDEMVPEEERLLYVAMTRSERNLYLTYAKSRAYRGRVLNLKKSSFLDRLEKDLIHKGKRDGVVKKPADDQLKLFE